MIRALIIEDEIAAYQILKDLIGEFISELEVIGVAKNVQEGIDKIKSLKPDIVFLDIRLQDGDGFAVLEAFETIDFEIIFTTAYSEFRDKAFDHFALQYLTKPIELEKLERTIQHYKRKTTKESSVQDIGKLKEWLNPLSKKIALPVKDGHLLVEAKDIIRCEGFINYTTIVLHNGQKHTVSKTLKFFESVLNPYGFFRIHKSHLVNTSCILEVKNDGSVLLSNNELVVISQRSRKSFFEYLNK